MPSSLQFCRCKEILSIKARLNQIYVEQTGQDLDTIERAMERDNFMTAEEAQKFGLIDEVIKTRISDAQ